MDQQEILRSRIKHGTECDALEAILGIFENKEKAGKAAAWLVEEYGSIYEIISADSFGETRLKQSTSKRSQVFLNLLPDIIRRATTPVKSEKPKMCSPSIVGEYCKTIFCGVKNENFYMLCLNTQNRLQKAVRLAEGTINEALVYPRLAVENALRYRANAVILAHNHPGGSIEPSKADLETTKKLKDALGLISVKVLDHIIVAGRSYSSLAESGLI